MPERDHPYPEGQVGHNRLGRLPKTARWREVTSLVASDPGDAGRIAVATMSAAEAYLKTVASDTAFIETYGLLVHLMSAARGQDFEGELGRLGISVEPSTPAVSFVAEVADRLRRDLAESGHESVAGEYATLALRTVLFETVGTRPGSLFGASADDLRQAFRDFSGDRQFGQLSQRFFGDFVARVLRGALDREVPRMVETTGAADALLRDVDLHAHQSARIVRDFAADWYSSHRWTGGGDISDGEVRAFLAVALRKMRSELKQEAARS